MKVYQLLQWSPSTSCSTNEECSIPWWQRIACIAKYEVIDGIDGVLLVLNREGPPDLDRFTQGKGNGRDHSTNYECNYLTT